MAITYSQCRLKKTTPEGELSTTSWIPSEFAVKAKIIKLRSRGSDVWDDGWEVVSVGKTMTSEAANERSQEYKTHHHASDAYRDKDGHWVTPANR